MLSIPVNNEKNVNFCHTHTQWLRLHQYSFVSHKSLQAQPCELPIRLTLCCPRRPIPIKHLLTNWNDKWLPKWLEFNLKIKFEFRVIVTEMHNTLSNSPEFHYWDIQVPLPLKLTSTEKFNGSTHTQLCIFIFPVEFFRECLCHLLVCLSFLISTLD